MAKVSPGGSHFTGSHKVQSLQKASGIAGKKVLSKPAYSAAPVAPAPSGISQSGAKALGLRAKSILKPLADPSQSIAE